MNNKGQVIVYSIMIGIVIIIFGLAISGTLKKFVDNTRNETSEFGGLDCNNESISNFNKAPCLSTDLSLPVFIMIIICIGGAAIAAKYVFT